LVRRARARVLPRRAGLRRDDADATAAFLAADVDHHHVAINVWRGTGVPPAPADAVGLRHWTIVYETDAALAETLARLEAAGVPVERRDDGVLVRDPWEIAVLLQGPARTIAP
jgi:catechol 2,3-dioxygenase